MNRKLVLMMSCASALFAASAVEVQDVTARQRWPWNNLVDVDFKLAGAEAGTAYRVEVSATHPALNGDYRVATTLVSEPIAVGDGTHRVTWDAGKDFPALRSDGFQVKVAVTPFAGTEPVYLVVDLSAGHEATCFPHRYTTVEPDLTSDVCRTTELWLRRIPAGTFTMGSGEGIVGGLSSIYPAHQVKLSHPYYIGIFELTQKQYFLMEGTWPSYFANEQYRDTRPVENVTMRTFRATDGWYDGGKLLSKSCVVGRLRDKTGLLVDLPSDAQWEHACRAGTTGDYYDSAISYANIYLYARCGTDSGCTAESDLSVGTGKVGTFPPNPWGLYDMYGNVAEFCPDGNPHGTNSGYIDFSTSDFSKLLVDPLGSIAPGKEAYTGARTTRGLDYQSGKNSSWINSVRRTSVGTDAPAKNAGCRLIVKCEE